MEKTMTKEEALEKYPNLEYMTEKDLVALLADADLYKDEEFKKAVQALLKSSK